MMRAAPHTLPPSSAAPSAESDSQAIADFVLYDHQNDDLYFRSTHFPSHPFSESISSAEQFSVTAAASSNHYSDVSPSYTAMLGAESTAEDLHSHHQAVSEANQKAFYSLSPVSQSLAGDMAATTSAPPFEFVFPAYASADIPRSMGTLYEDSTTSAPGILINPPTFPYVPTAQTLLTQTQEYRSATGSPATSAGGAFDVHSSASGLSGSESGSIMGSPFGPTRSVDESLQELAFNSSFVDPTIDPTLIHHHSPQQIDTEPPLSAVPSIGSPTWTTTHSPPPISNPSSPEMGPKSRNRVLSPYTQHTHRAAPYPQRSRRPSMSSLKSRSSGHGSPSGFPMDYTEEMYQTSRHSMPMGQPPKASSIESQRTRGTRITSTAESTASGQSNVSSSSSSNTVTKDTVCPECKRSFRDLRAHQLTHQLERPEKCPIATCEYSKKGFARKYDCQRHTLTHYKGTMVCGFCPGSGSAAEKSFNRADVFKRHLMAVHNVEQTPPNGRKKLAGKGGSAIPAMDGDRYSSAPYVTGKCSTCGVTFATPQQFYEHLDDCVLSKVVQEEPAAAFNEMNLDQVKMEDVEATLSAAANATRGCGRRAARSVEEDDEEDVDDDDELLDAEEADDAGDDTKDGTFTVPSSRKSNRTSRTPSTRSKTAAKGASGSAKRPGASSSGSGGGGGSSR